MNNNMNNTNVNSSMLAIRKFLRSKNFVTFICVLLAVVILLVAYNYRVKQATQPINVPYAKTTIQPGQKITSDMIGTIQVAQNALQGGVVTNYYEIEGKYSNYNTIIAEGSLFYDALLIEKEELPDVALYEVPDGYTLYYLPINLATSFYNSIMPGNFIDLYLSTRDNNNKAMVGKLISNVQILAVKTSEGLNVFQDTSETRIPSVLIFAVPEDIHILLRQIETINSYSVTTRISVISVPNTHHLSEVTGVTEPTVSSDYLRNYIEARTTEVLQNNISNNTEDLNENPDEGE